MSPILNDRTLDFISRSPEQTQRLGVRMGTLLEGGDIICLEGELGAGKTCFAQGVGSGWGAAEHLISPTYVLVREYLRPNDGTRLHHVDLYRVSGPEDALTLGLEDFLGDIRSTCIIEWPETASALLPEGHLWITLEIIDGTRRRLQFSAVGDRHTRLLQQFRKISFGA
jgi:tRNA threonylcarbamoyladenosine biosynthesis protein TsaE